MSDPGVSLVIPGRDCAATIHRCLAAVVPMLEGAGALREIIFVDDGSTDETPRIVQQHPVRSLPGPAMGPGAARNVGWRAAAEPLVWFIDADCVAEPEALDLLLPFMDDPGVGGVGGSYANMCPESLLARLIHDEIIARHRRMPGTVDFVGGFNALYRRSVLESLGGFDEVRFNGPHSPGAEDAELAYRVRAAGYALAFEPRSRVGHFHPTRLGRYLRSQRRHGRWRVALHALHRRKSAGDDYSNVADHVQPPLALLTVASLPLLAAPLLDRPALALIPASLLVLMVLATLPMTARLLAAERSPAALAHVPLSMVRALWRGIGLIQGGLAMLLGSGRRS